MERRHSESLEVKKLRDLGVLRLRKNIQKRFELFIVCLFVFSTNKYSAPSRFETIFKIVPLYLLNTLIHVCDMYLHAYHIPSTIFKTGDTAKNKIKSLIS